MHAELNTLAEFVVRWGLGWRYIVSRQFRRRINDRWASRSRRELAIDVAVFVIAFVVLNGLIVLTCLWLYDGIMAARVLSSSTT
jgi:hypothetical protein